MSTASERERESVTAPATSIAPGLPSMVRLSSFGVARFGSLIGESEAMRGAFGRLERAAETDATLLLQGEPGTGKEEAALAIHRQSARSSGPFLIVDGAAGTEAALAAQLFGQDEQPGAFEQANAGTLLLTDIGALSLELQERVLGVLEHRAVQRIDSHASIEVDVRLIVSTPHDLRRTVAEGRFRSDLYFRLSVLKIVLPSLRERSEDIAAIAHAFLEHSGATAEQVARFTAPAFLDRLRRAPWPANVRELRSYLERCLLTDAVQPLPAESTPPPPPSETASAPPVGEPLPNYAEARKRAIADFEHQYLRALLERTSGNVSKAAREAGIDRVYMHRLMRRHRVKR